jgi:hypothetical protein
LQDVPLSVAELIARWHASDPVRALSAARAWVRGTETVQSIRDAMEESLPKGHGGLVGAASERAYRAAALEQVTSVVQTLTGAVQDLTGSSILSLNTRQRDPESGLKYDFIFEISGANGPERVAVLVVWSSPQGRLVDVTPTAEGETSIVFAVDTAYPADFDFTRRPQNRAMNIVRPLDPASISRVIGTLSSARKAYEERRAAQKGLDLASYLGAKTGTSVLKARWTT